MSIIANNVSILKKSWVKDGFNWLKKWLVSHATLTFFK